MSAGWWPWRHRPAAFRRAAPADAAALAAVHATGFRLPWETQEFERMLVDPLSRGWVATDGPRGPVVGFVLLRGVSPETEVLSIALAPRWRGSGVARGLMERAFGELAAEGFTMIFLEVEEGNGPALRLYDRAGFQEVGRRAAYYRNADGSPVAAIVMRRDIA
ncbi:GNAT family N-acetyltransferase [Ancylobacter terrae]|uniref:GNAT family N-acetyltransferase n=1 Tax=Ancylobacter sp. sgz301288 TaxID=3342077 RepID=UPI0038588321